MSHTEKFSYKRKKGKLLAKSSTTGEVIEIANFKVRIKAQNTVINHDGSKSIFITVIGWDKDGNILPKITIPIEEYDLMNWPRKYWGLDVEINNGKKLHFKDSITYFSNNIKYKKTFTYTGYIKISDQDLFLAGNRIIGAKQLGNISCDLPLPLKSFRLSRTPKCEHDISNAINQSLSLLGVSANKPVVGAFIIGMLSRAVLSLIERPDFTGFIVGPTGSLKSSFAGVAQAHFGKDFNVDNLPAHCISTGNANEELLHIAKHVLIVIDDFKYRHNYGLSRLNDEFDQIVRCTANGSSRLRQPDIIDNKLKSKPSSQPLFTGETVPICVHESLHYRVIYLDINPGDLNKDILNKLYREAKIGTLSQSIALFIQHVIDHKIEVKSRYHKTNALMQGRLQKDANVKHDRTIKNFSSLIASFREYLKFAANHATITNKQAKSIYNDGVSDLITLADRQAEITSSTNILNAINEALNKSITNNHCYFLDFHTEKPAAGSTSNGNSIVAGWVNTKNNDVYIDRKFDISILAQYLPSEYKNAIPCSKNSFWKFAHNNNFLISDDQTRGRNTRRITINGHPETVYHTKFNIRT